MTPYDFLLIILGCGLVIFAAFQKTLRMLFMLAIVWFVTLLSVLFYERVTVPVQAIAPNNPTAVKGIVFLVLWILLVIAGYIVTRISFPVTDMPKIGFLDVVFGGLLGIVMAAVVMSLVLNTLGYMVSERWETQVTTWSILRRQFLQSRLRPYVQQVMRVYGWTFALFFRRLPPILIPR